LRVHSISLKNFGPFKSLEKFRFGHLSTIIGQNDAGKSHILLALQIFLEDADIEINNIYERVVIEVAFTSLPDSIELEGNVKSTLRDEMLLDAKEYLRIMKTYAYYSEIASIYESDKYIVVNDFIDENFANLARLNRDELDERCKKNNVDIKKRGPGATNRSKREALRAKARDLNINTNETVLELRGNLNKLLSSLLPHFELFTSDGRPSSDKDEFQDYLLPILDIVSEDIDIKEKKDAFIKAISQSIKGEIEEVIKILQRYTDTFSSINISPRFSLQEAIKFDISRNDKYGTETSVNSVGSGSRRLLMLAFFQYLAEKKNEENNNFIFAIEEPENCLHPGLQRELANAFNKLANKDYQIIITSHSPVFVGQTTIEDLALVTKNKGFAEIIQYPDPNLNLEAIADQLGIEPKDQIRGYNACVFVEGPNDIEFWESILLKLKRNSYIEADFKDKNIGFIIHGGGNLKHWIDLGLMNKINKHFAVIIDSDRKSPQHNIDDKKLNWKKKCEEQGGKLFILRKREIENYIHREAIIRSHLGIDIR